jgi:hypothetical protein
MRLRHARRLAGMADLIGAACAYAIILGMLATAIAPLFMPLFQD